MKITKFGTYDIPQFAGQFNLQPEQRSPTTTILGASGVFDNLGDAIISQQGTISVNFTVHGTTWAAVDTEIDNAKKAFFPSVGRNYLEAVMGDDVSTSRRILARCLSFNTPFRFDDCKLVMCTATFEPKQSSWDAISTSNLTENSASFNVDNTGSTAKVQRELVVRLNGALPAANIILTNTTTGLSFIYDAVSDPVGIGEYRDIDCGAFTVVDQLENDKYEFLTIGNNQVEFMALEPGINAFTLNPSATVFVTFTWRKAYV